LLNSRSKVSCGGRVRTAQALLTLNERADDFSDLRQFLDNNIRKLRKLAIVRQEHIAAVFDRRSKME
jgi:hypothetical protein